jgi:hypothetical protein
VGGSLLSLQQQLRPSHDVPAWHWLARGGVNFAPGARPATG